MVRNPVSPIEQWLKAFLPRYQFINMSEQTKARSTFFERALSLASVFDFSPGSLQLCQT